MLNVLGKIHTIGFVGYYASDQHLYLIDWLRLSYLDRAGGRGNEGAWADSGCGDFEHSLAFMSPWKPIIGRQFFFQKMEIPLNCFFNRNSCAFRSY